MKYLHTMVRVSDLDASLDFYCNKLGLVEVGRSEVPVRGASHWFSWRRRVTRRRRSS